MSDIVRVFCPACDGESRDPTSPACLDCLCGGFVDINQLPDGSVPPTHPDGSAVRMWVDALLPEWPRAMTS
jgi:hypothetical protein